MKPPPRQARTARDVRQEAVAMARRWARDRMADGDPEGAGVIRDLADAIARIKLLTPKETDQ